MNLIHLTDELLLFLARKEINHHLLINSGQDNTFYQPKPIKDYLRFGKLNNDIEKFINVFRDNFTSDQFNNFLENLSTLTISRRVHNDTSLNNRISTGYYDSSNNEIVLIHCPKLINKEQERETFYHELMHMASTKRTKKEVSGFEIPNYLGVAINEGYTEYLTQKYFTKGKSYVTSSDDNLLFAKGIENIIGSKKMEELYFSSNLNGLINELSKYSSRKDVIKLLYLMDKQHTGIRNSKGTSRIIKEIAKMNKKRLDSDYQKGYLSDDEYKILVAERVSEYNTYTILSESRKVIKTGINFHFEDENYCSSSYHLDKEKQKKYQ